MTSQKPTALPVQLKNIPADLRVIPRWVTWRHVQRTKPNGEKVWAKLPMTPDGGAASSTDPNTWSSFEDVCDALIMGGFSGIGLVLGADVQGIDLDDCRDPDTGALSELAEEVLEKVEGYAEVSPSGTGIKLFSKTNLDSSRTKKEVGVELYREGRYFTVTGHQINGHECLPVFEQDLGWFVQKVWGQDLSPLEGDAGERALALYKEPLENWDLERVVNEVLPHLDADGGYEDWLLVGAALHHQGQGSDDWLEAWDMWSQGSGKYVEGYCAEKWRSFSEQRGRGRGVLTLASLLKKTSDQRQVTHKAERVSLTDEFKSQVEACADARDLQDQVAAKIANTADLSDIDRELLAGVIQAKAKDLGVKLPIGTVRGWLRDRTGATAAAPAMPDWAEPWVCITEGDKFFNTQTKQEVTAQGFRTMHNRYMPFDQKGNRERADQWATDFWSVPVVAHKGYMPGAGVTFEMFGLQWVNLYRPESVPAVPTDYSQEDLDAIDTIKQHLDTYLGDARERELLMSWCAHNVQHPGQKIRWSPYIHGVPGDGKSFFLELIAAAMGGQNVRSLNGSTLESNFTDWAVGYAVVGIEEMKQHGHNRYDIMNRVKPFITNTAVEIHPKGKASYTAPNVSNYIIFSNYLDGAPVDEGDRRYMFLSSQMTTDLAKQLTEGGYFKRLFDALHEHDGAIRKWLLEMAMHPEFDANGRAPDTEIKRTVIEMSKNDLELAAEDLIERGADGVGKTVLSSAHLTRALVAAGQEAPASTRVNTLLTRLGYRFAFRKKWRGEACRVWLKQGAVTSEREAVEALNLTCDAAMDFLE